MRVFILTLGTRGDFELFCTLARQLARRGHDVLLGASGFYAGAARGAGLRFVQIGSGSHAQLLHVLRSLAETADRTQRTRLYASRWLGPQLASAREQIAAAGVECDYFVSNLKLTLQRAGRTLPGAFVSYDPPPSVAELERYGSEREGGRIIELVAMSQALVDPHGQWGQRHRFTGFWHADRPRSWTPPPELRRAVEQDALPVVMTMGSMVTLDFARFAPVLSAALRATGRRGVVVGGWMESDSPLDGVEFVREADYDWLFPRCACVLHHGGVGTLAAVLRAGRPSIVLPQILSQALFGQMLVRERLASAVLDSSSVQADALAAAIGEAVNAPGIARSAAAWRERTADEGGVVAAAQHIEAHWRELSAQPQDSIP
jgi:O-mycaminosyltylonolide 6-deoxyallosyltransferase